MDRHQYIGQALPASSSLANPTLAQQGYTADQGAEIGIAVSAVPLIGLLLGGIALYALNPSDAVPKWLWAVLGGGIGLAAGNALGVAAVGTLIPGNPQNQYGQNQSSSSTSFNELAFYQNLQSSLSSQIASAISPSASATLPT